MLRRRAAVVSLLVLAAVVPPTAAQAGTGPDSGARGTSSLPPRFNPCATIGYAVNATGAKPGALQDVKAAMVQIHRATGLTFKHMGATRVSTNAAYPKGVQMVIEWVRPGQGQLPRGSGGPLGVGGGSYTGAYLKDGRHAWMRVRGEVSIDVTQQHRYATGARSGSGSRGYGSRVQLLVHEIAHAVGADHTNDRRDIMYPFMNRANAGGVLTTNDKRQLQAVGKAGGCLYKTDPTYRPAPQPTYAPEPDPTPEPEAGGSPTPSPTGGPASPSPTGTPTATPTPDGSPTGTAAPTGSPTPGATGAGTSTAPPGTPEMAVQAFDGINRERVARGLAPLKWIACATASAQQHTQAQADQDRMHHQSGEALDAACGDDDGWGENVAWTSHPDDAARRVVQMWVDSPGHLANLTEPRFTHAGMGYVKAPDGKHWFTQVFMSYDDPHDGF